MTTPKLLLADDSATIRKVVELTFADEGIDVFGVADGDAAMVKFVEVQPDIVLVDVEMPGPTGYQICEMIKQDEATCHIPVLLLVGSFEPFDQGEAERVGADGFITKPFSSIRELVADVRELLKSDEPPVAVGPEIEDIEELYSSSFAETVPIQDYDTEEDLFQEAGMNAETVQTDHGSIVNEERTDDEFVDLIAYEDVAEAFSPDAAVRTAEPEVQPFQDVALDDEMIETHTPAGEVNGDPTDSFSDAALDDEMIEAVHFGGPVEENGQPDLAPAETLETEPEAEPEPETLSEFPYESQMVKDFDWSPAAKVVDEPVSEPNEAGFEPRFVFADAETVEGLSFALEKDSETAAVKSNSEPSEELVVMITQRVVEKLSDRVIREIAQEAVPRIAEKLIREALEEENKT